MTEPLSNEEIRLGERLTAHLDAIPLEEPRIIARSVVVGAADTRRPRHGRDALLVLIAAAAVVGGIGAATIGAIRLGVVADTVVLPPGPSLPAPPPLPTPALSATGSPVPSPTAPPPVALVNGDVLIGYGGRVFLTDPTGEREAFELAGPDGPDRGPQWSPDGRRILVLNGSVDGEPGLSVWVMRPDGRGAEQLTGTPDVPIRHALDAVWSPDGTRIALRGEVGGRIGLHVLDVATRSIVAGTTDAGAAIEPAWSPDGTAVAFHMAEGRIGVWTIGKGAPTVVVDAQTVSGPMWGPNATILFTEFVQTARNGFYGALFQIDKDGSARRQLTDPGNGRLDTAPQMSPDGTTLMFHRGDQFGDPWSAVCCGTILRSFETGAERLLGDYGGVWSPDGRWIAASADNPAVAPEDPSSMKNEWVAVRVSDGEERLLLVRNAFSEIVTGRELSWGPRPPD